MCRCCEGSTEATEEQEHVCSDVDELLKVEVGEVDVPTTQSYTQRPTVLRNAIL